MSKLKTGKQIFDEMFLTLNNCQYMLINDLVNIEYISKEDLTKWLLKRFSASAVDDLIKELERDNK